jgi:malate dehydrogenase (oxaloacetate-decarboxylating)
VILKIPKKSSNSQPSRARIWRINFSINAAPRCFEIEAIGGRIDIPVFHDDQYTAIATLAVLMNSLKLVKKIPKYRRATINGAGAAGIAIAKFIYHCWCRAYLYLRLQRIIISNSRTDLNPENWNSLSSKSGTSLMDRVPMYSCVSAPGAVSVEMVKSMAKDAIDFAMANPIPEIRQN